MTDIGIDETDERSGRSRRWFALCVISVATLMISVDSTIVNIALPAAQESLGMPDDQRQWVLTAYLLAFGGLLLFGGRLADHFGRVPIFVIGVLGFTVASVLGGLAQTSITLILARALQGLCAAMMTPAALSTITADFPDPTERKKALGIFSAISGSGAAVGLIAGGVFTEFVSWRWALLVNVPIGIGVVLASYYAVRASAEPTSKRRLDVTGAVLVSGALMALILGFSEAERSGWLRGTIWIGTALVLLAGFVIVELRASDPLLPIHLIANRTRAGVYLSQALSIMGMFGLMLFLTYYLQVVSGYSALRTGFAFLPLVAGMLLGATVIVPQLPMVPPRFLLSGGSFLAAIGMGLLTLLRPESSYMALVLPAAGLFGLGLGLAFPSAMFLATYEVGDRETGVASALINASQQVGGAIGAALLSTIAASGTGHWLAAGHTVTQATVHGYAVGAQWATGLLILSGIIAFAMVRGGVAPSPR